MSSEHHYYDYTFGGEDYTSSSPIQPLANTKITNQEIKSLTEIPHTSTEDLPHLPILSPEEELVIKKFFESNPNLKGGLPQLGPMDGPKDIFHANEPWIQTYSGRRFTPTNPMIESIVIQDIAHALSMQCRFSGHVKKFYSVGQHSVLVSYLCNYEDQLHGLLHDASEAYLVDVPSPLKRSGKFDDYLKFEDQVQKAIYKRFDLTDKEPPSVKLADRLMLATEARDLMFPRDDWELNIEPLPFIIEPWSPEKSKTLFMKRFFQLVGSTQEYEHYLANENKYGKK